MSPKRDTSQIGQAMEFRVWTELIQQSRGTLHIFLPLLDNGLDAVAHNLLSGEYIPVQVKGRHESEGRLLLALPARSLVDDRAVIIAGLLEDDGLGPYLLVVDEGTFKRLAAHQVVNGKEVYEAAFTVHPTDATHWRPYLIPLDGLAARLLGTEPPPTGPWAAVEALEIEPEERHNQWLGFLGEAEIVRRLAENPRLDLFRPFPDLEMVEVLARDSVTGRFAGLQIKTAVAGAHGAAAINVQKSTFVPSPSTSVVGLVWLPSTEQFADECLVIPTERLREVTIDSANHLELLFRPNSPRRTQLDPFRCRLSELGSMIGGMPLTG